MTLAKKTSRAKTIADALCSIDISRHTMSLCLVAASNDGNGREYQRVQIADSISEEFRKIALAQINRIRRDSENGKLEFKAYDAGTKLEQDQIEFLIADEFPSIADQCEPLTKMEALSLFQGDEEFISQIRFYALSLTKRGEKDILMLRLYSPKKELSRSRSFAAIFSRGQFDKFEETTFLFDQFIDCISYDGMILILSKDRFQKIFRYFELLEAEAEVTLESIKAAIPIENFDLFQEDCLGHLQKLAKLHSIVHKPYLAKVKIADMKKVIKKLKLPIGVTKRQGKEMIVYDRSDRWAILRLLDDDYLESLMTGVDYEVNSKRPM